MVHERNCQPILPRLEEALAGQVEFRADSQAQALLKHSTPSGDRDFDTEFLDYVLAVKVVSSVEEAIRHIGQHSTGHSEAIVTENSHMAERFTLYVDLGLFMSMPRPFTDGGEFGLGLELGISTQKMHARGPMGLREMNNLQVHHHRATAIFVRRTR